MISGEGERLAVRSLHTTNDDGNAGTTRRERYFRKVNDQRVDRELGDFAAVSRSQSKLDEPLRPSPQTLGGRSSREWGAVSVSPSRAVGTTLERRARAARSQGASRADPEDSKPPIDGAHDTPAPWQQQIPP
jgi:hypothetical protein